MDATAPEPPAQEAPMQEDVATAVEAKDKQEQNMTMRDGSSSSSSSDTSDAENDDEDPELAQMRQMMGDVLDRFSELENRSLRRQIEVTEADLEEKSEAAAIEAELKVQAEQAVAKLDAPQKKEKVQTVSKRHLKQLVRPDVAQLKMRAPRPDLVEAWDVTAPDPELLVYLKAYRNMVRVPIHWNQKRKHLSVKRTVEKVPFKLPDYIEATKISEIRAAILEKESKKTLKQKQREKARPKSHRLYLDYKVLHDAFFKYATRPDMTGYGEVYYEGKEREDKARAFKPGQLSPKLREAIGMLLPNQPPPWLFLMQRFGPPPSYPNLKIPGVNVGIPAGAQWGLSGWGQPPSTVLPAAPPEPSPKPSIKPEFWGEVADYQSSDEEEEEDEQAPAGAPEDATDMAEPDPDAAKATAPDAWLVESLMEPN